MTIKPTQLKRIGITAIVVALALIALYKYDYYQNPEKAVRFPYIELILLCMCAGTACIFLSGQKR